jgi:hypothetical protein
MTEDKRNNPDTTRLERLYRQAADAEPESRIDEAVLGEARSAASSPRRRDLRHPGAWGAGLAAAASLVLAVGLVFQYGWQPTPETGNLEQFRDRAKMEQADTPSAPAAGDNVKRQDGGEPAAIEESAELNRIQVTGARTREEMDGESREAQKSEADEARMAAPPPAEEAEQRTPEAWLEKIRELVNNDEMEEARHQLRLFKEAYPAAEIPVEIREAVAPESE